MRHKRYVAGWSLAALVTFVGEVVAADPTAGVGLFGTYVTLRLVTVLVLFATPMETFVSELTSRMPSAKPPDSGGGD